MTKAVLYDYWRSTASWRVRIALNLAGIEWESRSVDLLSGAQAGPDHLARNPQGLLPVLEIDGLRLTQSMAILDYLEETGRVTLLPEVPAERARMRAILQAVACDIHPVCNLRVAAHAAEITGDPEAKADWMRNFIGPGLAAVEALLPGEIPYAMGAQLSQADLAIVPQLYNARRWDVDLSDLPGLLRIEASCAGLPAFRHAEPERVRPAAA